MSVGILILSILVIGIVGGIMGHKRALSMSAAQNRRLHSLPHYYFFTVFLFATVPSFLLVLCWLLLQPVFVEGGIARQIVASGLADESQKDLVMADVRRVADGIATMVAQSGMSSGDLDALGATPDQIRTRLAQSGVALGAEVQPGVFEAARDLAKTSASAGLLMTIVALVLSVGLGAIAFLRVSPEARARNLVEQFVLALLIGSSMVAILTTFGIVFSMLFETVHFFQVYPAKDFFLSLTWSPRFGGGSQLGLWPLLWGTLYVSFIALLFAVPVGLLAAIYLSEYAGPKMRAVAKPVIEMLAGIPTIVYGLFALITVGPMLRDYFAQPMGLGTSSSSVLTAGLVMGIMLIPFVSSLSDDIINAVPQSMRDGSYGLGANQSETVRQVILPAALPGVVGAILLAASRAIGETMIVVMGAGAAAQLSLNPLEAMTTITVKIVSQLTGDTEFASPETLVAFALGLTLFIFTLGLNVLALVIVRKYREQYE